MDLIGRVRSNEIVCRTLSDMEDDTIRRPCRQVFRIESEFALELDA